MNALLTRLRSRHLGQHRMPRRFRSMLGGLLLIASWPAIAGPGAHGPNGEHLDGPTVTRAASSALPRVDAHSESFELVAELRAGELSIVVDRYESNEPVLGARLEVETGALKAVAVFRAEHGDYVVTDAALLRALATPGEHALVFTLLTSDDSDLLDATLANPAGGTTASGATHAGEPTRGGDDARHGLPSPRIAATGAGVVVLVVLGALVWWRRRRREAGSLQGALR